VLCGESGDRRGIGDELRVIEDDRLDGSCLSSRRSRRTPTRRIAGTISLSCSIRFAISSGAKKVDPVTLPPGWARLATRPTATASLYVAIMIGMVELARLAAGSGRVGHDYIDVDSDQLVCEREEPILVSF
jgi:hypothetical protein